MRDRRRLAVIGLQFGDEGKGKIVDYVLNNYGHFDSVFRYNGGANAGHTIIRGSRRYALHIVPSGILFPHLYKGILEKVVFDPLRLASEIKSLIENGISLHHGNLGISSRCNVTVDYHYNIESHDEEQRGAKKIDTTKKGIGPTYSDRAVHKGIRFGEFLDKDLFEELFMENVQRLREESGISVESDLPEKYAESRDFLKDFVVDEGELMRRRRDGRILYEGAQGVLLDVGYGTQPFSTSSSIVNKPHKVDENIGVMKAYITRVGKGPLITRMDPKSEAAVRGNKPAGLNMDGSEYGTTTGRPRDCGWPDLFAARYAVNVGDIDSIVITKLDRLAMPDISICTGYKYRGSALSHFPENRRVLENSEPIYTTIVGWSKDGVSKAREWSELPQAAKDFILCVEGFIERPVNMISVGSSEEETIHR